VLVTGRADFVDRELLRRAGVAATKERRAGGYTLGHPTSPDLPREERVHMPERVAVKAENHGQWVGYETAGSPVLTRQGRFIYWQPPDLADPSDALVPHSQIGTVSPYVEAARAMLELTSQSHGVRASAPASHEPLTFSCWSSGGVVHVLLGNLESGWMGDSRFGRTVTVVLPRARLGLDAEHEYHLRAEGALAPVEAIDPGAAELQFTLTVPPQGCVLARLETNQ